MKPPIIILLMFWTTVVWSLPPRLALVIGNADYAESPLRNPVNDAQDMAAKLKSLGFKVTSLFNADYQDMDKWIRRFTTSLEGQNGVGLFYYAGHGLQVEGQNYLVPVDAQLKNEADVRYHTIKASWVVESMSEAQANNGINLVVLDACRNNPFKIRSLKRSISRGFARMEPARGTLILYATEPGKAAQDGDGRNGVFTGKLLEAMGQPGVSVEEVFKNTALAVDAATDKAQTPWQEGLILGHFYFISPIAPTKSAPADANLHATIVESDTELEFWHSTDKCATLDCYESYLQDYARGRFAKLARAKIKRLKALEVKAEADEWQDTSITLPPTGKGSQLDNWLFGRGTSQ